MKIYKIFSKNNHPAAISVLAALMMYGFDVRTFFGDFLPINIITSIFMFLFIYFFCYITFNPNYPRRNHASMIDGFFLFFFGAYGLRLFWNIYVDGYEQLIFNNDLTCFIYMIFLCIIPYFTFRNINWDIVNIKVVLKVLIFIFLVGLLASFKTFITGLMSGVVLYQGRADANNYLDTIGYGHLALTFILACFCLLRLDKGLRFRWLYYVFMCFGLLSMGLANSRSPFLVLALLIGISILHRISIIKVIISCIIFFFVIVNLDWLNDFFLEKFNSPFIERTMSVFEIGMPDASNGRDVLFSDGLKIFKESPILGESIVLKDGEFRGSYVHNAIIEVLMGLGLIGGMVYSLINIIAFFASIRLIKFDSKYMFFAFVFIQYFIFLQFSRSLLLLPLYWVSIASVYSCYTFEKKQLVISK